VDTCATTMGAIWWRWDVTTPDGWT